MYVVLSIANASVTLTELVQQSATVIYWNVIFYQWMYGWITPGIVCEWCFTTKKTNVFDQRISKIGFLVMKNHSLNAMCRF